jgi:hypothetical protein
MPVDNLPSNNSGTDMADPVEGKLLGELAIVVIRAVSLLNTSCAVSAD